MVIYLIKNSFMDCGQRYFSYIKHNGKILKKYLIFVDILNNIIKEKALIGQICLDIILNQWAVTSCWISGIVWKMHQ